MSPSTIALVDDDVAYAQYLGEHLRQAGPEVHVFLSSAPLLAHPKAYDYDFYVLDLMLPGIDGVELIKVLRLRTNAGILVVSGRLDADVLDNVLSAGADLYLAKPVKFTQVELAIANVERRLAAARRVESGWRLDARARQLVAPAGARIDLSAGDLRILECFLAAGGKVVDRETLQASIGHEAEAAGTDGVYAAIYRLRRRIEKATDDNSPLQAKAKVGYVFKAPLALA